MRRRFVYSLVGASLLAGSVTTGFIPATGDPQALSTLTKSAQDVTHPGASPVNHADVVNWVVNYSNNGPAGPAPATITDQINGAGTAQSFVPGSLHVPPGWTPSWSTDGTNFGGADTGTSTVAIRATNPSARPGGTSLDAGLLPPVQANPTATGGDGFTPIIHRTASGTVESWNVYHHAATTQPKVVCVDLSAGGLCAGGPWPKTISTTPGPLGSGPADIASSFLARYVEDPGRPGVVYYPAGTTSGAGIGCLDLVARASCGYFPLTATAFTLSGLETTGGNVYGIAADGEVLCMAIATRSACPGQPYAAIVPGNGNAPNGNFLSASTISGGKIFATSVVNPPVLGCFDPATNAACAGWAAPKQVAPNGFAAYSAYAAVDTAGNPTGACATSSGGVPVTTCFTLAGAPMAGPTEFGGLAAGVLVFSPAVATTADGHLRGYYGVWGGPLSGATVCHDWTAGAACAGFPLPATHPSTGATRDYGYAYDETTRCLVGLGDAGVLFSVDPLTAASPCIHSGASISLTPGDFYCDGGTSHVRAYQSARLENLNLANVDLAASGAEVSDSGGVIATPAIAPNGTIDLSGISVAAHPSIEVSVHLALTSSADFSGGNHPTMTVSFAGDAPQVCFRTTVASTCTVTAVTNTATAADVTGTATSNTVSLPIAPGYGCQPVVYVNKEICASHDDHDCGAGGYGPWVKKAPVGILGLLLAHPHWRITITNAGPVGIVDATLNDAVEPSCRTAAGTFSLAAGASKQVFCSTSILVNLLPLTNAASATYTPANSPAGTPPATTAPSSAVACNLLCIL
jgi:hypothetical protein